MNLIMQKWHNRVSNLMRNNSCCEVILISYYVILMYAHASQCCYLFRPGHCTLPKTGKKKEYSNGKEYSLPLEYHIPFIKTLEQISKSKTVKQDCIIGKNGKMCK